MPTYSSDGAEYLRRVHANGRSPDQTFGGDELLFRRLPKGQLINGWPVPAGILAFDDDGVSVNRSRYSLPQDVLEPDCCGGHERTGHVVLEFAVADLTTLIPVEGREFFFLIKHNPLPCCYPHSLIWCNAESDAEKPYVKPSKTVRNLIRAEILTRMKSAGRFPREFAPVSRAPEPLSKSEPTE